MRPILSLPLARRIVLALAALLPVLIAGPAAAAGNVAETFVTDNIHKGLDLLNNKSLSAPQKREQFESFLVGLTDMKRIAMFTLGQYRRTPARPSSMPSPPRSRITPWRCTSPISPAMPARA